MRSRPRNTGEKLWKRRRKGFEEKEGEADGQTYEPGAFWPQLLWVTCVFLKLKLCSFWRSAAHSVHDNFPTVHCRPIKVYVFEVCGFIASAWIKWFSRKLSFSTIYPSQKWVHKCFVSASGTLMVLSVTISPPVLNLRHSCTSPALFWSLGSNSIAIAWEKKVPGSHRYCWSIGWLSISLNHTFLAKSAIKLLLLQKKVF